MSFGTLILLISYVLNGIELGVAVDGKVKLDESSVGAVDADVDNAAETVPESAWKEFISYRRKRKVINGMASLQIGEETPAGSDAKTQFYYRRKKKSLDREFAWDGGAFRPEAGHNVNKDGCRDCSEGRRGNVVTDGSSRKENRENVVSDETSADIKGNKNDVLEESSSKIWNTRKVRVSYADVFKADDDLEGGINLKEIRHRLNDIRYEQDFVKEINGADFNLKYAEENGLASPILVKDKKGLGMEVPPSSFDVKDITDCVGPKRILDVMDVTTQKNFVMSMKEWQLYYENKRRDKLYNVISLEFSRTRLEKRVRSPALVRQLDWVDCVWPRHLKDAQTSGTNSMNEMKYPKVQNYCLMSVKGCYTDFHIDFGGSTVWYHILKGSKAFFLIPPTEKNITLYEKWVLSKQTDGDAFFGDMVGKCARITLKAGNTLIIPSGWIHAVYTITDSIVFGGNFLHSFGMEMQLRIAQVEQTTKVPQKHRYPFFTQIQWYVLERYLHSLTGKSYLMGENEKEGEMVGNSSEFFRRKRLTEMELNGLEEIVKFAGNLAPTKKDVPHSMRDGDSLLSETWKFIQSYRYDVDNLPLTSMRIRENPSKKHEMKPGCRGKSSAVFSNDEIEICPPNSSKKSLKEPADVAESSANARRRTRCKMCPACTSPDCGKCAYCKDMVKFGGSGRSKKTCVHRKCANPFGCRYCQKFFPDELDAQNHEISCRSEKKFHKFSG